MQAPGAIRIKLVQKPITVGAPSDTRVKIGPMFLPQFNKLVVSYPDTTFFPIPSFHATTIVKTRYIVKSVRVNGQTTYRQFVLSVDRAIQNRRQESGGYRPVANEQRLGELFHLLAISAPVWLAIPNP